VTIGFASGVGRNVIFTVHVPVRCWSCSSSYPGCCMRSAADGVVDCESVAANEDSDAKSRKKAAEFAFMSVSSEWEAGA
jgi:hypothetical protein